MATKVANCLLLLLLLAWPGFCAAPAPSPSLISRKAVTRLPGFNGPLPFSLETGYVEVDGVRLFYYFVESERNPREDPVLLWLTGGPGCSGFSGLVLETGPLSFDFEGYTRGGGGGGGGGGGLPTLLYRPESWTRVSNVIFVDSPAGTGFSYATTNHLVPSDTAVVHQLHTFLTTWFHEHPQLSSNPLYIAGDSYSGIIIPALALHIAKGSESSNDDRLLNLKGYIAGNPVTDYGFDGNSRFQFLHGMGIIPDELYEGARRSCKGEYQRPSNAQCANSVQAMHACIRDLNDVHVLEPRCDEYPNSLIRLNLKSSPLPDDSIFSSLCRNATYFLTEIWANDETVRETLGVHKGTVESWRRCYFGIPYTRDIDSTVDYHLSLITKGYRAMVYSGDHDSKISFVGTQAWIRYLNLSITDDWRPWYVDRQVAGFTRTYSNNLTYATVKGAGHTAPEYNPRECLAMVDRWLSGQPL